jgi:hypothetical protein
VGCNIWINFDKIDTIHKTVEVVLPDKQNNLKYEKLLPVFALATGYLAQVSEALHEIEL